MPAIFPKPFHIIHRHSTQNHQELLVRHDLSRSQDLSVQASETRRPFRVSRALCNPPNLKSCLCFCILLDVLRRSSNCLETTTAQAPAEVSRSREQKDTNTARLSSLPFHPEVGFPPAVQEHGIHFHLRRSPSSFVTTAEVLSSMMAAFPAALLWQSNSPQVQVELCLLHHAPPNFSCLSRTVSKPL